MKKIKTLIVAAVCVSAVLLASCSKNDATSGASQPKPADPAPAPSAPAAEKKVSVPKPEPSITPAANKVSIEYRFDVQNDGSDSNYFYWTADGSEICKDGFDVTSGASIAKSTNAFNVVRYDNNDDRKKAIPLGLRNLMLEAVAPRSVPVDDYFTVNQTGKKLLITFVHRGTGYRITTDDDGMLDTATSFEITESLIEKVDGKSVIKKEFAIDGADVTNLSNADLNKVTFIKDVADPAAKQKYSGKLQTVYENGVLCVTGSLTKE